MGLPAATHQCPALHMHTVPNMESGRRNEHFNISWIWGGKEKRQAAPPKSHKSLLHPMGKFDALGEVMF